MKKLILLLLLSPFGLSLYSANLIDVMRMVNKEVDNQNDLPKSWLNEHVSPLNFNEAIQIHLLHTKEVLSARNLEHLNSSQIQKRNLLLNTLYSYALEGRFPINKQYSFQTPIFIDEFNTHCAVGYLMQQSGYEQLAKEISKKQNLAYVREITVNGVSQWASEHGFTIDELAWIQPGYPPNTTLTPLLNGMNGTVYSITEFQGVLYAAGSFDTADVAPANNIATYISGFAGWLWTEVDQGTNGPVRKLIEFNGELIAAGDFTSAGGDDARSVARLNNGQWQAMGDGLDGIVYDLEIHNGMLYAFGDFNIIGSDTDGKDVAVWNGNAWDDVGLGTDGAVYAGHSSNETLYLAGDFSVCGNSAANNLASFNGSAISSPGNGISAPVYDVIDWNNNLIASTIIKHESDTLGVMKLNNTNWECLPGIRESVYLDSTAEYRSLMIHNNQLYVTGKFSIDMMLIFGSGVARWGNIETYPEPLTYVGGTVFTSVFLESLYIGGDFHIPFGNPINAIAILDDFTTHIQAVSTDNATSLIAYPNPNNTGKFMFKNYDGIKWLKIYNLQGKLLNDFDMTQTNSIELRELGVYIIESNRGDHIRVVRN